MFFRVIMNEGRWPANGTQAIVGDGMLNCVLSHCSGSCQDVEMNSRHENPYELQYDRLGSQRLK